MDYRPHTPFNVAMKLLTPAIGSTYGVNKKTYSDPQNADVFYGSFRTFGGSEGIKNDVVTAIDTAVIDTWYRPDIKAECAVYICETGDIFEIIGRPEDIDFRHQFLKFKVQKVGGKT